MPAEAQAQPPKTWVVVNGDAASVAPERAAQVSVFTRPNRTMLMTSLFTLGQAYVASAGIAATSRHFGDSNLWVPVVGPWLDLGARPSCSSSAECSIENGNRVLLVADGVLQTFGAYQLVGAFIWPETVTVARITTASGVSVSFAPGKIGREGYGLSATGHF
jgi:hypothetical protein